MSIGVYFKLATRIVRTFTNFYLFVYWKPTRNVRTFTHCCLRISNPCARCEILFIDVYFKATHHVRTFTNSHNVQNETSLTSSQQNIKFRFSLIGARAWTPGCLQKWPQHPPANKATDGFIVPPCWQDRTQIPSTAAASNCQTLTGFLQLHRWKLNNQSDLPATELERVPRSGQNE